MNAKLFPTLLLLLFIALKLCHVIDWSWWWVAAPAWIPAILALLVWTIIFTYYTWFETKEDKSARLLREVAEDLRRIRR